MTSRTLKTNFTINVLGAIVPVIVALVTVPIYVRHIGDARYGVLSIVWVLLGYFGFLDLGLSRAAANALARMRDAPQQARARVLMTTLVLNVGLGLFGSLCLAIFGSFLLQHILGMPEALKPEIEQAFPWIVGLFPLALASGVGIGARELRERFLLANVLQVSGTSLGQIVPVILAVMVSSSLTVVIPAAVVTRALTMAAILIAVYRNEGPFLLPAFDRHQAKKLLSYGGWISISGIVGPILTSLDQFVIGSVLGVAAITHYAVPMNLITRSQVFASALARTLFPRMSSVGPEEARDLAARALLCLAYGYGAICAPAMIMTPVFFKYWIGADFAAVAAPVAEILFLGGWINGLALVPHGLLQSQGRPDLTSKFHLAEVVPFVGALWGLTSAYGLTGAALAWSMRCAADAACLLWAAKMPRTVLLKVIIPPLFLLSGSHVVAHCVGQDLWISLAAATVAGLAGGILAFVVSEDLRRLTVAVALRLSETLISDHGLPPMLRKSDTSK